MEKLKEFALAHFEKAVLGICGVLLLWFLADALRTPVYKKQPADFAKATDDARKNVEATPGIPAEQTKEFEAGDYVAMSKNLFAPISAKDALDLNHSQRWQRAIDLGVNFRDRPEILAPGKPMVQSNRGLMMTYLIDDKGDRVTRMVPKSKIRKIPKSDARFEAVAGKMGFRGGKMGMASSGDAGRKSGIGGADYGKGMSSKMKSGSGEMAQRGGGGGGGYPGMTGGAGAGMMGGSASGFEGGGDGLRDDDNGPSEKVGGEAALEPNFIEAGKQAKPDPKKGKEKEEQVPDPITARQGFRWVEIVAPFPHAEQIVKYVEALKDRADAVPLFYAYVEVERATLDSDGSWSEFKPLDSVRMYRVIDNALQFQPEKSAALVKGLSMGLPGLNPVQRKYLHQDLDIYARPEPAEYEPRHIDPLDHEAQAEAEERARRMANPNAPIDEKKAADAKAKKTTLGDRTVGKLGGPAGGDKGVDAMKGMSNRAAVKTALARFWDFTVDTGATYKYRMQVKVFNPNYKRTDVFDADLARPVVLPGPWSVPSDPVHVEPDAFWFVAEDAGAKARATLPTLNLEVQRWVTGMGQWMVQNLPQRPGQVIGVANLKKNIDLVLWNANDDKFDVKSVPLGNHFDSGHLLLSVEGNQQQRMQAFGRSFLAAAPRSAVSVDADGVVQRRSELADADNEARAAIQAAFDKLLKAMAAKKPAAAEDDKDAEKPAPGGRKKGGPRGPAGAGGGGGSQ